MDAGEEVLDHHKKLDKDIRYLVSGACHPDIFKMLDDYVVYMYYPFFNTVDIQKIADIIGGVRLVQINCLSSTTLGAFSLANYMGCYKYDFYGFDCCYPDETMKHYAGTTDGLMEHRDYFKLFVCPKCKEAEFVPFESEHKTRDCQSCMEVVPKTMFVTAWSLMNFVEQFVELVNFYGVADQIVVHGNNLVNAWITKGQK
jgi:hypothetical protein